MTLPEKAVWHQICADEAARLLEVDPAQGLAEVEVKARQATFGANRLPSAKRTSGLRRWLLQFHAPLVYLLLAAAGVTALLGEWVDSAVIMGVVLMNAVIGFLQESKAEKSIDALSQMVVTEATVRRQGTRRRIPSSELVPGDIVFLQSGDKVPADLRLLLVRSLQVDESALTGESVAVEKHSSDLAPETILADRKNLAFASSLVTSGQAEGIVYGIGQETEVGRIAGLVAAATDLTTPLTRKIEEFSKVLMWGILGLAVVTFGVGVWRGEKPSEMFMAAVALAVGAIPEGLPAAVTITLAIGVGRMARWRAIIRHLPAVETLGSTTVICSDKTGTLTENKMTVQEIYAGGRLFQVTGSGYGSAGEIMVDGGTTKGAERPALRECLRAGLLCNDAQLLDPDAGTIEGDPTEAALLAAAHKGGLSPEEVSGKHPRLDVFPFESEHRFMATLHRHPEQPGGVVYLKGAVERLLSGCTHALSEDGELAAMESETVHRVTEEMAARGLRVLAFARKEASPDQQQLEHASLAEGLTFLGLQGMMDPPRAEAVEAVRKCQSAGIEVKMITGDHLLTATAIARQIGLRSLRAKEEGADLIAVSGQELEQLSEEALTAKVEEAVVFGRVAPEQKLTLVRALQARGHVVAMTGDGVNDAPALKQADIGIAMGITGTDVAKGAADMLLTDDNFASIQAAVEEGRSVFDNLTKFIIWTLPTSAGSALTLLAAILAGLPIPALPTQLLWVNMTTAVFLGLMLVFEPKEDDLMQRPPRSPGQPILTGLLIQRTVMVTLFMLGGAFGLFLWEQRAHGATLDEARTVVVNVIVMVEVFYLLNCRSLTRSIFSVGFFSNPRLLLGIAVMVVAQGLFTYLPLMNRLFHSAPIKGEAWLHIVIVALAASSAVAFEKWLRYRSGPSRRSSGGSSPS